jgi:nucleoside-diphosphate-sugar epimerase
MRVLITGVDGYLGWPTLLRLSKNFRETRIIGVDNFARRRWVQEIGAVSANPIAAMNRRLQIAREYGYTNISFIELDLTDYSAVNDLLAVYKPEAVIHLAAQPSAPYSQISAPKAHFSQENNMSMTRNLLWGLKENGLMNSHFIETTTTGIYGAPSLNIPEGEITALGSDGSKDRIPYPNMASSWYHVSKGFNATNMQLMHFQTKMPISDVRTSIVYGFNTEETKDNPDLATRFDFDFYFGTLFNRWCVMAIIGEAITVYGSGNQIKPFIHLEDAVESLVNLVKRVSLEEYVVYNQLTEYIRIGDLAQMIKGCMQEKNTEVAVKNIANPRVEREDTSYRFENAKFLQLLSGPPRRMLDSVPEVLDALIPYKERISQHKGNLFEVR